MNLCYAFFHFFFRQTFKPLFRLRVLHSCHVPHEGPVLLLSNHQSYLDPILCAVGLKRQMHFMARDSLFYNRYFGWLIRNLNAFPVQRGQADLKAIKEVIRHLKQGHMVLLFPEATRSDDGRIRPIKGGFELILRRSGATLVPMVVEGAFDAWPRKRKLFRPKKICVCYGEPISAEKAGELGREELIRRVNEQLHEMQNQLRLEMGKRPFDEQPVAL